jgi:hypothetical protein
MPLQRYDTDPVERPSGLVPPTPALDGVTELRVHGVGGTTPVSLLGDDAPLQVAGDRIAGFYRTADVAGRHVEAYSWGGLTSRSGFRALWVLLLPFALVNLAGWMCAPAAHEKPWLFRLHRATVRWAAFGQTINLIAIAVLLFVDLTAYQCGGQSACAGDRWWLAPLRDPLVVAHPGRRVVLGMLPVLVIVVVLALLTRNSLSRYEAVEPPYRLEARRPRNTVGAAARGVDLTDPAFWDGERTTRRLGRLHIAATLAFLSVVVAHVASTTTLVNGAAATMTGLRTAVLVVSGLVLVASAVLAVIDLPAVADASWWSGAGLARLLLSIAGVALIAGLVYAWGQPASSSYTPGQLPGMANVSRYTWLGVLVATGLVAVPTVLARSTGGLFGGPAVAAALGSLILNLVGLAVLMWYAVFLAPVWYTEPASTAGATVHVSSVIGTSLPITMGLVIISLVSFAAYEAVAWWWTGRRPQDEIAVEYESLPAPDASSPAATSQPDGQPATTDGDWRYSILAWARMGIDDTAGARTATTWLRRIARARRAARAPHDVKYLLLVLAAVGVLVAAGAWVGRSVPSPDALTVLGSRIVTLTPVLLLLLVRNSWTSVEKRRRLGILWDIGTFWPRAYHPLAPPCYAERAVPDLQRRLWRLHDAGGRTVVAAHSQGTIISAAALLQADKRPPDARVALATFGAPLRKLYQWAFPYYFRDAVLHDLWTSKRLAEWRNYHYRTDYIGGAVLPDHDTSVDEDLKDPLTSWLVYGQPPPPVGSHSGYWTDPVMWADIDRMAADL